MIPPRPSSVLQQDMDARQHADITGTSSGVIAMDTPAWPHFLAGQPGQPVRVLLVDDDAQMRRVVTNELMADMRVQLVATGTSQKEGRKLIAHHEFEVLLVDLNLGDGDGFALIECCKQHRPMAEVVVVSAMEDEDLALKAFACGATGYLVKNSWFGTYAQAVLQVVNGGASITPNLARRPLRRFDSTPTSPFWRIASPGAASGGSAPEAEHLTQREKDVLRLVASGYTSMEAAGKLMISVETVNAHIKNIYRKLQVRTRAQAVNKATTHGWL